MNVILLGAPGVGKGTIAGMLVKKYNLPQISTGDIFRSNIKEGTELGKKAKSYIDAGKLVPDDVVIDIVKDRLNKSDAKKGYFLDGFPRTIPQAEALEQFTDIDKVLNILASEEIIVERVSGRRTCRKCAAIYHVVNIPPQKEGICDKCGGELFQRDDDKPETVRARLQTYEKQTSPLTGYYKKKKLLVDIDGELPLYQIFDNVCKEIENIKK